MVELREYTWKLGTAGALILTLGLAPGFALAQDGPNLGQYDSSQDVKNMYDSNEDVPTQSDADENGPSQYDSNEDAPSQYDASKDDSDQGDVYYGNAHEGVVMEQDPDTGDNVIQVGPKPRDEQQQQPIDMEINPIIVPPVR